MILSVVETKRLRIRHFDTGDAAFILKLLNEPSWLRYIGDKGVRTLESAERYLRNGPIEMYARLGFGLYLVELRDTGEPIGMCGLIKRDALDDVDLGFALLSEFRGRGYAREAASAVAAYGIETLGLPRIAAITSPDNESSIKLLGKLGFRFERLIRMRPDAEELKLYQLHAMQIRLDDLSGPKIHALLEEHLQDMARLSPPESVHALDIDALRGPGITFWTIWSGDELLGCGALKELGPGHGEIKSMRTSSAHRRKGAARAMLGHIIDEARRRSYARLSLETGSMSAFDPAQRLYASFGFTHCSPFADYVDDPNSVFMTRAL